MEKLSDQGRLRPWMGFVLFGVVMAFFIFVCAPLQQHLGIPGLVLTELGFLIMAVVYCLGISSDRSFSSWEHSPSR